MTTNWADELIGQYTVNQLELIKRAERLDRENPFDMDDLKQINSMIESMAFSMDWMATGRQPGTYRGADKRAIYQRQHIESMDIIPDITEQLETDHKQLYMTKEEKIILADIFASMSLRERQCYVLHEGRGISMKKIADDIGLKKRTVQQYIERAREKVKERVGEKTA